MLKNISRPVLKVWRIGAICSEKKLNEKVLPSTKWPVDRYQSMAHGFGTPGVDP